MNHFHKMIVNHTNYLMEEWNLITICAFLHNLALSGNSRIARLRALTGMPWYDPILSTSDDRNIQPEYRFGSEISSRSIAQLETS